MIRPWQWRRDAVGLRSAVACAADQWYFVDAETDGPAALLTVTYSCEGRRLSRATAQLEPCGGNGRQIGWMKSPPHADCIDVSIAVEGDPPRGGVAHLGLHPVDDVCAVGHPSANTPRWSDLTGGAAAPAVLLPGELSALREWLEPHATVERINGELLRPERVPRRAIVIIDAARGPALTWRTLQALSRRARVVVDLATMSTALAQAGVASFAARRRAWRAGVPAARVVEACAATRGFALEDALPCAWLGDCGRFRVRTLGGPRAWKRCADRLGMRPLLTLSSPDGEGEHETIAAASADGDLVVTDLPWMLAGRFGPMLAPRVAAYALRAMLGLAVADDAHFWTPGLDPDLVVRDVADLARRYPTLRAVRWRDAADGVHRLGLTTATPGASTAHLMLHTGRADAPARSVAPEAMMVWMRRQASEPARGVSEPLLRARHARAAGRPTEVAVTWQFDSGAGGAYLTMFDSAAELPVGPARHVAVVAAGTERIAGCDEAIECAARVGLLGDGSIEVQEELGRALADVVRRAAEPATGRRPEGALDLGHR